MTITYDPKNCMYTAIIRRDNGHTELRGRGTLTEFVQHAITVAYQVED